MPRLPSHFRKSKRTPQKSSPLYKKRTPSRPAVSFARSPLAHASRPAQRVPGDERYQHPKSRDDPHSEGDDEVEDDGWASGTDSDISGFHWEEEDTLFSDLMEEPSEESEEHNIDLLTESLHSAFAAQDKELKKEIAKTLVSTHNHVKAIFSVLDQKVDASYARGSIAYNTAWKKTEEAIYAQSMDFREALKSTQAQINTLYEELRADYEARDALWIQLKKNLDEIVSPVLESTKDTPAKVERTIAKLEKHSKTLENDKSGTNFMKGVEELLKRS
ncbi:unnamed protein product [Cyclocybe aegerita]|uniref:Uncharacterized protein n=1 Tax=Cyclocybe aegerita TaxID=1973307 RepID=A0A8S0WDB1_CYCAE|nr:unnamed protein product [Cyclocybe aegerita]